MIVYRA